MSATLRDMKIAAACRGQLRDRRRISGRSNRDSIRPGVELYDDRLLGSGRGLGAESMVLCKRFRGSATGLRLPLRPRRQLPRQPRLRCLCLRQIPGVPTPPR
jgi:hypothetical protein